MQWWKDFHVKATTLAELIPLPYSCGRCHCHSWFYLVPCFFLSPTLDVIRMSMVTVFFLPQLDHGTKWNGFKSRFNKHLLYLCSLWLISLCFPLCFLLLLVLYFLCLAVAVQTYLEWISFKTKQTTKTKHKNKQQGR